MSTRNVTSGRAPGLGPHRLARCLASVAAVLIAVCGTALAAPISVPNGDFSDAGNIGSVGGGIVGGSGTDVPIGAGPWTGTYQGVLGLLAPPTLAIDGDAGTISGLAAVNVLGILDNGGHFGQTLAATLAPEMRYTLSAEVDTGAPLDVGLLSGGNFGIALTSGGVTLASTVTAPAQLVSLQPIGGTAYALTLTYETGPTAAGAIGIELIAEPTNLIGATLMTDVAFDNITLDGSAIDPVSSGIEIVGGSSQSATVGTAFADPLAVRVTDALGDPVEGAVVTFAAPSSGASAALSATTVATDANGEASVGATANTIAGAYAVTASVDGIDTPASFALVNEAGAPAATIGASGIVQSAPVGTAFPEPLVVLVTDAYDNPVSGATVTFGVPASGASAVLSDTTVATDANGMAAVTATANATVGSYDATATVDGIAPPASYQLTNLVAEGTTVGDTTGDDQSAEIGSAFACALTVHVVDASSDPVQGYAVDFVAPDSGASAILSNGVVSGTSVRALTDANGDAVVVAVANDVAGDYAVTATLVASNVPAVEFLLSNLGDLLFADGFDVPCTPPFAAWP